jgi:hypothetical protein
VPVRLTVDYDTKRYPLAALAARTLRTSRLEQLWDELRTVPGRDNLSAASDHGTNFALRDQLAATGAEHPLRMTYHALVVQVIAPAFGGRISYTTRPTFRVHLPGTPAVSAWHRDADITGRIDYVNAWIPLVDVADENSLWIEDDYGSGHHTPVTLRYGQILIFDGGLLSHGSVPNSSGKPRVSMDLRFAPRRRDGSAEPTDVLAARPRPPYRLARAVAPPHPWRGDRFRPSGEG